MRKKRRKGFFKLTWGILILSIIIYALDILLILQLVPVFEKSDILSETINLVVAPANFFIEDVAKITSSTFFDVVTWILQFFYAYLIACILRRLMSVRVQI